MGIHKTYEYVNDFLYIVLKHDETKDPNTFIYCSGINLSRFSPITKGRYGICSNPAMRGLQLVNLDVRSLALSKGASIKTIRGNSCTEITPSKHGWYKAALLIENAPDSFPNEIVNYYVTNLLKIIGKACMIGAELPNEPLEPNELQSALESLCSKYHTTG